MTERLCNWQLVEFSENLTAESMSYVDCIPATWIICNPVTKILLNYYSAPHIILNDLLKKIKTKETSANEWTLWCVNIRGGAGIHRIIIWTKLYIMFRLGSN